MPTIFVRTCQECGHKQEAKDPQTYKDVVKEAWRDVKCKRCKSDALDYGSEGAYTYANGLIVDVDTDEGWD
jgi:hypothetical protein